MASARDDLNNRPLTGQRPHTVTGMKTRTVVIGLGLFGREIALNLSKRGHSVLAIDRNPSVVEQIKDEVDQAVAIDTTDYEALDELKVADMDTAVCAIGAQHIENSILTTALLSQMKVSRIICRAADSLHGRILRQVGATEVVNPEQEMGRRIANQIASPGLREVLRLTEDVCVAELPVPQSLVGQTPKDLNIRQKYGVTIIGVQRAQPSEAKTRDKKAKQEAAKERPVEAADFLGPHRRLILNVGPDRVFEAADTLIVVGNEEDVKRLNNLS